MMLLIQFSDVVIVYGCRCLFFNMAIFLAP
ncbi:Uncharacterised protein [Vibrio cholerae]|nr:Uncharacterised protein [Vibrio cholerae]CSI85505.1 Uncharacterised protein [Vibrio cholerae]